MDFIERLFGVGSGGESGALDTFYVLVLISVVVCWALWRRSRVSNEGRHVVARSRKNKGSDLDLLRR